jgi:hypothetical protein
VCCAPHVTCTQKHESLWGMQQPQDKGGRWSDLTNIKVTELNRHAGLACKQTDDVIGTRQQRGSRLPKSLRPQPARANRKRLSQGLHPESKETHMRRGRSQPRCRTCESLQQQQHDRLSMVRFQCPAGERMDSPPAETATHWPLAAESGVSTTDAAVCCARISGVRPQQ